jgi:phosphate transport system permease protein
MAMNKKLSQNLAYSLLTVAGFVVVIPVALVVYFLVSKGHSAISWSFFTQMPTNGMTQGGILSPIIGTLCLMGVTAAIALPIGLISAIYLAEYAKDGPAMRIIRLAIVNLAGVPSIVFGLFGYALFVLMLFKHESIIAGGLTLAIMSLPVIIVATEEALKSVPDSFREASLGLGATKWQTIYKVVLPNAMPGIITGTILALSRAAGETAPILFTVAAFYTPFLPINLMDKVMTLPYHLYILSTQVPNAPVAIQWGTALTLLILVLGLNLVATLIRRYYRSKRVW